MFTDSVMPKLQQKCGQVFYSQTVKIVGPGESSVETQILDMLNTQENPTIAPYAKTGEVHLRVTARAKDEKKPEKKQPPWWKSFTVVSGKPFTRRMRTKHWKWR